MQLFGHNIKGARLENNVKQIDILHVNLPLKRKFKHAITERSNSESIFLRIILEDNTIGYGESLPREYVTGETIASATENLKKICQKKILNYAPKNYEDIPHFVKKLDIKGGAARCALELALLDVYGRYFRRPASSLMGARLHDTVTYSGVIQAGSIRNTIKTSFAFKIFGLRFIKVKVGIENDNKRLCIARAILGKNVNIRVDANCAWSPDEAIEKIKAMQKYNISAVEQPVAGGDHEGLKKVTDSLPQAIIADESLCTIRDAVALARLKACNIFNIRISKCGGLMNSLEIADIAQKNNIGVQLGCQVGESGLLSAAGRHFANTFEDISFCEGSYGAFLLKKDITKEDIRIHYKGIGCRISGPGLGVNVVDRLLNKYALSKDVIR